MRILLLLSGSWNDQTSPNNNMTNWFENMPNAEIWTISGSSQLPENKCCSNYFLIGENKMIKSILGIGKAGARYCLHDYSEQSNSLCGSIEISQNKKIKNFFSSELARLARDIVWRFGKYDMVGLKKFIEDCNPDIIFSQRRGSIKMCRLEKTVSSLTNAPMVAYTGDDEYSLKQFSLSPIFWIRRFWVRAWLKKVIPTYKLFYNQSVRQMKEFSSEFNVSTKFLVKCGEFDEEKIHTQLGSPIQLVYAGKLYCNRWKTLGMIADAIREVNDACGETKFQLNIYTGDSITNKQNRKLNDGRHTIIHGKVSASELTTIYKKTDIVLHVESFDLKNRLLTQDSFSTKIMDCLASGCAVMAVCWEGHAAYQYLKEKDAAITASSKTEIAEKFKLLSENPMMVFQYARKAYECGKKNHQREQIQEMLLNDFSKVIQE